MSSSLRYRELLALLRHPLVPPDAEVCVTSGGESLSLGVVSEMLCKAYEFSEERLDAWLVDAGVQYEVCVKTGCLVNRIRMSDPL